MKNPFENSIFIFFCFFPFNSSCVQRNEMVWKKEKGENILTQINYVDFVYVFIAKWSEKLIQSFGFASNEF